MPKVSVVIPVYNVEKYLPATLGSLSNQTFGDFEALCVDNGSTDQTETEVKIFTDFLFRTLPVRNIKKLPVEAAVLTKSEYFKKKYSNARTYHSPSVFQRLFSISYHPSKPFMKIRLLGITVKFKLKQRICL